MLTGTSVSRRVARSSTPEGTASRWTTSNHLGKDYRADLGLGADPSRGQSPETLLFGREGGTRRIEPWLVQQMAPPGPYRRYERGGRVAWRGGRAKGRHGGLGRRSGF